MPTPSTHSLTHHNRDENLTILVTGGAGFIGSHLVEHLLKHGRSVVVVDDLSTGKLSNLPKHPHLRFIHARLSNAIHAELAHEQFDEIYHLAASVGVHQIVDEPIACIENNIKQTSHLLRYALTHGPSGSPARTLIASSSEVYGKSAAATFQEDDDVVYGPTTRSRWSYAASKAIDEYLALAYHTKHSLPSVIVRFFNTVGPRQVGTYGMVLPNFVNCALKDEPLTIYGDGKQSRCFCDVRDVVQALPKLLASKHCYGNVFNLGSDTPIKINQLADLVITVLSSQSEKVLIPYDQAYAPGFEDLRQRRPDLSRLHSAIGFEPRISLEQTINDIAAHLQSCHEVHA